MKFKKSKLLLFPVVSSPILIGTTAITTISATNSDEQIKSKLMEFANNFEFKDFKNERYDDFASGWFLNFANFSNSISWGEGTFPNNDISDENPDQLKYLYDDYINDPFNFFIEKNDFIVSKLDLNNGTFKIAFKLSTLNNGKKIQTDWIEKDISEKAGMTWKKYLDLLFASNSELVTNGKGAGALSKTYESEKENILPSSVNQTELYKNVLMSDSLPGYWAVFNEVKSVEFNDKDGTYSLNIQPKLYVPNVFDAESFPNPAATSDKSVNNTLKWITWANNDFNKISYRITKLEEKEKEFISSKIEPDKIIGDHTFKLKFSGFKTEAQRLNEEWSKIQSITLGDQVISNTDNSNNSISEAKYITYEDAKKKESYKSILNSKITGGSVDFEVIPNDNNRSITLKYKLKSNRQTEGNFEGDVFSTKESTITISGFPAEGEPIVQPQKRTEQDEINALTADEVNFTADSEKLASSFDLTDNKKPSYTLKHPTNDGYTRTLEFKSISGYDDVSGKLKVKFKIVSTKGEEKFESSEELEKEITGYQTEAQRLNKKLETIIESDFPLKEGKTKENTLPSTLTTEDFNPKNYSTDNFAIKFDIASPITPDDTNGTASLKFRLDTTKTKNQLYSGSYLESSEAKDPTITPVSSNTKDLNTSGWLTTNKKNQLEKAELNNLSVTFDYPNKSTVFADAANKDDFTHSTTSDGVTVVIDSLENVDKKAGSVTVKYHLVKNGQSSDSKTYEVSGFKSEKQRLDSKEDFTVTISDNGKSDILASSRDSEEGLNALTWEVNPNTDQEIVNKKIVGYDDINGVLWVSYQVKSKKDGLTDVESKVFTTYIDGYQTEKQRLDKIASNNAELQAKTELDKKSKKPSSWTSTDLEVVGKDEFSIENNNAIPSIKEQITEVNDDEGTLNAQFSLVSKKPYDFLVKNVPDSNADGVEMPDGYSKPKSDVKVESDVKKVSLNGFLTNLEEAKNNLNSKIDNLKTKEDLEEKQATNFKNEVNDSETDTVAKVQAIELKVDKQVLKNKIDKDYPYLNPKQKQDLANLIDQATNIEKANESYKNYSSINLKMKNLTEQVQQFESLIKDPNNFKYTRSSKDLKDQFDNTLAKAKELMSSTTNNGDEVYLVNNQKVKSLDNLIAEINTPHSIKYDYDQLNGKSKDLNQEIENFPYLNQHEKDSYKARTVNEGERAIENARVANNKKKEYYDQIQNLPGLDKFLVNRYEHLLIDNTFIVADYLEIQNESQLITVYDEAKTVSDYLLEIVEKLQQYEQTGNNQVLERINSIIDYLDKHDIPTKHYQKLVTNIQIRNYLEQEGQKWRENDYYSSTNQIRYHELILKAKEFSNIEFNHPVLASLQTKVFNEKEQNLVKLEAEKEFLEGIINKDLRLSDQEIKKLDKIDYSKLDSIFNNLVSLKHFDKKVSKAEFDKRKQGYETIIAKNPDQANFVEISVIKKMLENYRPDEILAWPWWLVLGLMSLGLINFIFFLYKKIKQAKEEQN
ncbi:lipoprotein 17-related variable surface protein [Mycoplasmopsis gallopavonis]|uniref:Lipoprotein-associated type-17 domain-containing protein n=1 Tax=Mycoplasmopsis gallopavonis TaxID=76629 RepID=A0A449AYN5_9BACT|nr:lipoprotein 17-related variable surface protein [Mycoplasmopsis gallopavonis]RIV16511.1 hypothetical protein D1113_02080 [Mycoplasmopsis gallopavonis]VEU72602.1 Uncharacterised protein [Mycoplasmopsis gallopavonis]